MEKSALGLLPTSSHKTLRSQHSIKLITFTVLVLSETDFLKIFILYI